MSTTARRTHPLFNGRTMASGVPVFFLFSAIYGTVHWAFEVVYPIFNLLSHIGIMIHATEFVESKWSAWESVAPGLAGVLRLVTGTAWQLVAVTIAAGLTAVLIGVLARFYWFRRVMNLTLPHDRRRRHLRGLDPRHLRFDYAKDGQQIRDLAGTEEYGPDRPPTNVRQVIGWWRKYPFGNWLLLYEGGVEGGIDIWPIDARYYADLVAGRTSEEHLDETRILDETELRHLHPPSHWYIASVSRALRWKRDVVRQQVLLRLVVSAITDWQRRCQVYPAHVVALGYTREGINLAKSTFGFREIAYTPGDSLEIPVLQRTFRNSDEVLRLLAQLEALVVDVSPSLIEVFMNRVSRYVRNGSRRKHDDRHGGVPRADRAMVGRSRHR